MARIQLNSDQAECAALARFLHERDIDAAEAPAMLAEMGGFIAGRAVTLGMMTRDEAHAFIRDRLATRMLAALEAEVDAQHTGRPAGGYAQWPGS